MKSLVVDEDALEVIKVNLRSTRTYRDQMLLDKRTDLLESFPYFFTNPSLVRFDQLLTRKADKRFYVVNFPILDVVRVR